MIPLSKSRQALAPVFVPTGAVSARLRYRNNPLDSHAKRHTHGHSLIPIGGLAAQGFKFPANQLSAAEDIIKQTIERVRWQVCCANETVPALAFSGLQLAEEGDQPDSAISVSRTNLVQAPLTKPGHELLRFFGDDMQGGIPPNDEDEDEDKDSQATPYQISISILGIFQLVGSIDPSTLTITAELFLNGDTGRKNPITSLQGSLENGASVKAELDAIVAKGSVALTAERNGKGKHDLYVDLSLSSRFFSDVNLDKLKLLSLPF